MTRVWFYECKLDDKSTLTRYPFFSGLLGYPRALPEVTSHHYRGHWSGILLPTGAFFVFFIYSVKKYKN